MVNHLVWFMVNQLPETRPEASALESSIRVAGIPLPLQAEVLRRLFIFYRTANEAKPDGVQSPDSNRR